MRIVRYYPNTELGLADRASSAPWSGLESEIGRLFDTALSGFAAAGSFPVEFHEDKDNAYVRAELPGVKREDIAVEVADGQLTVTATRRRAGDAAEQAIPLSRSFRLPEQVDAEKVAATYADGVLTVTLPKPEQAKPRKIAVEVK